MKKLLLTTFLLCASISAYSSMDASKLELKVYKMAVSTSPNCSNPVTVFTNASPSYTDFKDTPNLGTGSLADGTYPCVIIEFSDNIKVTPASNGTYCSTATTVTQDVCRDYDGAGGNTTTSTLIDGTTVTCDDDDNRVAMYLSTASSTSGGSDAFNAPDCNTAACDGDSGITLGSALTVSGTATGKFLVETDGKVCDGDEGGDLDADGCDDEQATTNVCACEESNACNILPPDFSFSTL